MIETQTGFAIAIGVGIALGLLITVGAFVFPPLIRLVGLVFLRWKKWRARGKPYCCHILCFRNAGFGIYGSSGHFEDATEACEGHVGALLGTPMWLKKESEHWVVYPIPPEKK